MLKSINRDRGATDPILVIAAIAVSLVLLVGGSFAVSGIVSNGHNLNAKSDLEKVAVAEASRYAGADEFLAYKQTGTATDRALEKSGVGFNPTEGGKLSVVLAPAASASGLPTVAGQTAWGWAVISQSGSRGADKYVRTSASQIVAEVDSSASLWKLKGPSAARVAADLKANGITVAQLQAALG